MSRLLALRLPVFVALAAWLSVGCVDSAPPPHVGQAPRPPVTAPPPPVPPPAPAPVAPPAPAPAADPVELDRPLVLGAADTALALHAGRVVVDIDVPASSFVSVGVFGPQRALLGFEIVEVRRAALEPPASPAESASLDTTPPAATPPTVPTSAVPMSAVPIPAVPPPTVDTAAMDSALSHLRAHRPLDEDGLLPRIVSFRSLPEAITIRVLVDAAEDVEIRRVAAPLTGPEPLPEKGRRYRPAQAPSIGFPAPVSRDEGFFLQSAARYQFARTDVIASLLRAFQRTRAKFKRDPIAIADISQWDGVRPATDLGKPRHISHEGGRDVDLALAANDEEPSTVRAHCTGVLIEETTQGCGPGTVRGFDAQRMAYFLGALFETSPPVEKIFVDDVYLRELRKAAERLHDKRVLKDAGFEGLSDDAIVRASPWHTDHLHVRFAGPPGKPAF